MLKILGRNNSSNVQKVLWVCDELEIQYEREDIGGPFGGNQEPGYLAMNPNGRVPTVIDDETVLWESNVIVRYLCEKHAPQFSIPERAGRAGCGRPVDGLAANHRRAGYFPGVLGVGEDRPRGTRYGGNWPRARSTREDLGDSR